MQVLHSKLNFFHPCHSTFAQHIQSNELFPSALQLISSKKNKEKEEIEAEKIVSLSHRFDFSLLVLACAGTAFNYKQNLSLNMFVDLNMQ